MKKTYIIPRTLISMLGTYENLLVDSAHSSGDVPDLDYGGQGGGMEGDVKSDRGSSYNVWSDDWSK